MRARAPVRPGARIPPRGEPPRRLERRVRLTGGAAGLLAVVLVLAASLVVPLREWAAQRARVDDLERRIAVLNKENDRLERYVERLKDREYLERLARECLGMVKPGEVAFIAVPEEGEAPQPRDC